jgi:DNA polymerase I-like protein with 3'-5' exonuclease and polymerase domains
LNRLIQGSAADQTKKSIVDVDAAGFYLQLQVHDELDLSVGDRAEAEKIAAIMREGVKLTVPSMVDIEIGPSWGEAE